MAPEATIAKYRGKYMEGWDRAARRHAMRDKSNLGLIDAKWELEPRPEEIPAWDSLSSQEQKVATTT